MFFKIGKIYRNTANMMNFWITDQFIRSGDLLKGIDTDMEPPADDQADQPKGKEDHPWLPKDWNKN
jgi:hypothetical protein